jgi:Fic family protein
VPPPHEQVIGLLEDLCAYLSGDDHPAVLQAALVHAQFETIHPFVDGNGRTGRALIHVVLRRRGLAPRFVPPISLIMATHADRYIQGLTSYRYDGAATGTAARTGVLDWVEGFVADTSRACLDAASFAVTIRELEARWRSQVGRIRAHSAVDVLLASLASAPVLTVSTAARLTGRSEGRTNDAVRTLLEAGILRQTTIGRRNRAFEVPDLIDAVTNLERQLASPVGDTQRAAPTRAVPARRTKA